MNRFVWLLLWLVALGNAAFSDALANVSPSCETRDLGAGLLFVRGVTAIEAPTDLVYAVVADFDSLQRYVSAIDSSQVVSRDSSGVLVRQVGTVGLLLAHRFRMELRFEEHPPSLLRFEIEEGDFSIYYGSWRFDQLGAATRLVYSVTLEPPAFVPHLLVRPMLERILCRTLSEVAAECLRRSAGESNLKSK